MLVPFIIALVLLAALIAVFLRAVKAPGWRVLAGLAAGIILGPTILGRIVPTWYEQTIVGGYDERVERDGFRFLRTETGTTPPHIVETFQSNRAMEDDLRRRWEDAVWAHQSPARLSTLVIVAIFFLLTGLLRAETEGTKPDWYLPLAIGLWSAFIPGALLLVILRWLEYPLIAALSASAAVAIGPALLDPSDRATAAAAETSGARIMRGAARIASAVAIAAMVLPMYLSPREMPFTMLLPLAAIPLGWILPRLRWRNLRRRVSGVMNGILIPGLAALIAYRIELFEHFAIWPMLAIVLLCGDGRWLGAYLGAMLCGARKSLRTMRLVPAAIGAASSQLALTAFALHAGLLSEPLAFALLLGALLMEMTTGARKRVAREIEETEWEIDPAGR